MEWISSLLSIFCPFCGSNLGRIQNACLACANELCRLEASPPQQIPGAFPVLIRAYYEGWLRDLILKQKAASSPQPLRWLARWLFESLPLHWKTIPWLWVPANSLKATHFVEVLALELAKLGIPFARKSFLARKFLPRAQKTRTLLGRKSASVYYPLSEPLAFRNTRLTELTKVILLDDVVTTGSTLTQCSHALREAHGIEVIGGAAIAFTPPKTKKLSRVRESFSVGIENFYIKS